MTERRSGASASLERLREFDRLSAELSMPRAERLSILNVTEPTYLALSSWNSAYLQLLTAELERRLSYALPMMRRMAGDRTMLGPGFARTPTPAYAA